MLWYRRRGCPAAYAAMGSEVKVTILAQARYFIVADVSDVALGDWRLIGVYGDPHKTNNQFIWTEIEEYLEPFQLPICLLGDFNAITA